MNDNMKSNPYPYNLAWWEQLRCLPLFEKPSKSSVRFDVEMHSTRDSC